MVVPGAVFLGWHTTQEKRDGRRKTGLDKKKKNVKIKVQLNVLEGRFSLEPGFYLNGLFLGKEHVEGTDRSTGEKYERDFVAVAVGTVAYRVYLGREAAQDFDGLAVGDPVIVGCRPTVSSRGSLSISRGFLYKK